MSSLTFASLVPAHLRSSTKISITVSSPSSSTLRMRHGSSSNVLNPYDSSASVRHFIHAAGLEHSPYKCLRRRNTRPLGHTPGGGLTKIGFPVTGAFKNACVQSVEYILYPRYTQYASYIRFIVAPAVGEKFSNTFSGACSKLPPATNRALHLINSAGTSAVHLSVNTRWLGKMPYFLHSGWLISSSSIHPIA